MANALCGGRRQHLIVVLVSSFFFQTILPPLSLNLLFPDVWQNETPVLIYFQTIGEKKPPSQTSENSFPSE
jgi:hypothetical protein